jgi:hypothetical protein
MTRIVERSVILAASSCSKGLILIPASVRAFSTWQRLLLLLLAIGGLAQLGYWAAVAEGVDRPLDAVCASWDREASIGIALLVPDPAALAESQLDYALFQLRRARRNCRAGWLDLARQDYANLRNAHPYPNRSLVDAARKGARP